MAQPGAVMLLRPTKLLALFVGAEHNFHACFARCLGGVSKFGSLFFALLRLPLRAVSAHK
jgi:hypothetical protein